MVGGIDKFDQIIVSIKSVHFQHLLRFTILQKHVTARLALSHFRVPTPHWERHVSGKKKGKKVKLEKHSNDVFDQNSTM